MKHLALQSTVSPILPIVIVYYFTGLPVYNWYVFFTKIYHFIYIIEICDTEATSEIYVIFVTAILIWQFTCYAIRILKYIS